MKKENRSTARGHSGKSLAPGPAPVSLQTTEFGHINAGSLANLADGHEYMIGVGVRLVSAREIEDVLHDSTLIREVAVVGAPHELLGEVPVAFVVPREGQKVTSADLLSFCRDRLTVYRVPAAVVVRSGLPRNEAGDLDKGALRSDASRALIEVIADLR